MEVERGRSSLLLVSRPGGDGAFRAIIVAQLAVPEVTGTGVVRGLLPTVNTGSVALVPTTESLAIMSVTEPTDYGVQTRELSTEEWLKVFWGGAESSADAPNITVYRREREAPVRGTVVRIQPVWGLGTALVIAREGTGSDELAIVDMDTISGYDLPRASLDTQDELLHTGTTPGDLEFTFTNASAESPNALLTYEFGGLSAAMQTVVVLSDPLDDIPMVPDHHPLHALVHGLRTNARMGAGMILAYEGWAHPAMAFTNSTGKEISVHRVRFPVLVPQQAYAIHTHSQARQVYPAMMRRTMAEESVSRDAAKEPSGKAEQFLMDDWEDPRGEPIVLKRGKHSRKMPPVRVLLFRAHMAQLDQSTWGEEQGMPIFGIVAKQVDAEGELLASTLLVQTADGKERIGEGRIANRLTDQRPFGSVWLGWDTELTYTTMERNAHLKGGPHSRISHYAFTLRNASTCARSAMLFLTLGAKEHYEPESFTVEAAETVDRVLVGAHSDRTADTYAVEFVQVSNHAHILPGFIAMDGVAPASTGAKRYSLNVRNLPPGETLRGSVTVRTRRA